MAQRVFWSWQDDDKTFDIDRWISAQFGQGVYNGFDFSATANMTLTLIHSVSGYKRTLMDFSEGPWEGAIVTKQGVFIVEDANITIAVDENISSDPRIDTVYVNHQYQEVKPGIPAIYSYAKGTPSATPSAPATPNPNTDTIIGYLRLPGNCTTLNTVGVTFTKTKKPNVSHTPNAYAHENYVVDGDTPHEAIDKLDAALKVLDDSYETNTLVTPVTLDSTEAGRYSKFITVDMTAQGDFFSAIIAFSGGNKVDGNSIPFYGLFEIRVQQTLSFGNNPTVDLIAISGNMRGASPSFIQAKIVDNNTPSTVEFHVYGGAVVGNWYGIRPLLVNHSDGGVITYHNLQGWAAMTGTLRTLRAKKQFKRTGAIEWPGGALTPGDDYFLDLIVVPNDGKKRSYTFHTDSAANFGADTGFQYLPALSVSYTSNGGAVLTAFQFGASYWPATSDAQKAIFRHNSYYIIDADPGTTVRIKVETVVENVSGFVRAFNIRELDREEFDIT